MFQHTAARRRLVPSASCTRSPNLFQHTAARRRLARWLGVSGLIVKVSTHSRPKAAGLPFVLPCLFVECFNTQPPEGGWKRIRVFNSLNKRFNTQPPEGGWAIQQQLIGLRLGFNTQPPEGGCCPKPPAPPARLMFQHTAARRRLGFRSLKHDSLL